MLVGPAVFFVWVSYVVADDIDATRDDESEELLARPQWTWLQDGRLRHSAIPRRQEHEQVHHLTLQQRTCPH